MNIRPVALSDIPAPLTLYRDAAESGRALFLPLDEEGFRAYFLPEREERFVCLVGEENGEILGFSAGNIAKNAKNGYITCVLTKKEKQGWGKALLCALEAELCKEETIEKLRIIFYNPVNLRWVIPETDGMQHPGMPGCDMSARAYVWFQNMGYRNYTFFNSYYKRLKDGEEYTSVIRQRMEKNEKEGLVITLYDREKHGSFLPLIESLGSEGWRAEILHNEAREHPLPMAVAVDMSEKALRENGGKGFVCGFAGPMRVEPCGRGYFGGIGIHQAYRRRGLGSTLFAGLCRGLCGIGADYMTLFTGENGAARNIYEAAGFRVGRAFAAMDKIIVRNQ